MPCLSSSSDRCEVQCRLGGPCRPPVTVGGDTRCCSGVAPLQSAPTSTTSPPSAPTAAARSCTWHSYNCTRHSSSCVRCAALGTRSVAQDMLPDRASFSAFWGTNCVTAGRRHFSPLLTVPHEVSEPLAAQASWRQLAGCHPMSGGETVEALPV
jgi:hypothetical protein